MLHNNSVKTILFLAANPKDTVSLRLDEELREIDAGLRRARKRDKFSLVQRWALRPRDLRQALLDVKPQIVHFSGHGSASGGIVLENINGHSQLVESKALAGLFKLFVNSIECVLLNACYSEKQAKAIVRHINHVIGMNQAIGDQAAIEFAVGFYDALGADESVEAAYRFGCNAIQLVGLSEHLTPVLKSKRGVGKNLPKKQEPRERWILVLSATIEDVDKEKAEAIVEHLRYFSGDMSLTLQKIESGSVLLVIESTRSGFAKIKALFNEKSLVEIDGVLILDILRNSTSLPSKQSLNSVAFEGFLQWLAPDRETARIKLDEIRTRLEKIFTMRGSSDPQEMADETIYRGIIKFSKDKISQTIEPIHYFMRLAYNVHMEALKARGKTYDAPLPDQDSSYDELRLDCLEKCLQELSSKERELIRAYYESGKRGSERIAERKELAARLEISVNALSVKVSKIRKNLKECVTNCIEGKSKM